jgi:tetratricopeptide (TPR) repeat protein
MVLDRYEKEVYSPEERYDAMNALLVKANRACELLQTLPNIYFRTLSYNHKARVNTHLGQHILALAAYREADELFLAQHREGTVSADNQGIWKKVINDMGLTYLSMHQLEAAKRCFQRLLDWPGSPSAGDRVATLIRDVASYHRMRKDWVRLGECCEEALVLCPKAEEGCVNDLTEVGVMIMLADAAEGQGDMRRAHEYDEKAKKGWGKYGKEVYIPQLTACHRRDAIEFPKAGRAYEAGCALKYVPDVYVNLLKRGINFTEIVYLETLMAALKVLAAALVDMGNPNNMLKGEQIRADVEETEAVLAGYWEGVLEETRWELAEQRRAVERGAGGEREKKSKAAKRKQQKRKA